MASVKPIPDGYRGVSPYLVVRNAAEAIEFYKDVFGATENVRLNSPGEKIGHAEIVVGGAPLMLSDEFPELDVRGPESLGGTPVILHLYVEDVDSVFQKAIDAGSTVIQLLENQFYGDRGGKLRDPYGHCWWIATHIEDVSPEETQERAHKLFG